jgi:hypothetical protein
MAAKRAERTGRDIGALRWLVLQYQPTSLFSLKMSSATSGVGKTLIVPTPYAVKMALVDVAFSSGWDGDPARLVRGLVDTDVRVGVPSRATVTHTIVKIRQEPKAKKAGVAYTPAVAYREFVHYSGPLLFAFDRESLTEEVENAIVWLAPTVSYIGKRGGFIQFTGMRHRQALSPNFTQPMTDLDLRIMPLMHLAMLDDFGPEANIEVLNSFSTMPIRRDKHRKFVQTLVPLGLVNVGPGFAEYQSATASEE